MERATKYNPMYESEATTGYSHYYRRYPEPPVYSSASAEASTDFSSEEIRHIYDNSELTKEVTKQILQRRLFSIQHVPVPVGFKIIGKGKFVDVAVTEHKNYMNDLMS